MIRFWFCVAVIVAVPEWALSQERMVPAPWKMLTGSDAGAAGTCIENDPEEGCLIVRCHPQRGLELVLHDPNLLQSPPRMEFRIGSWRSTLPFSRVAENEIATSLAEQHGLLRRFASSREVLIFTKGIENSFTIGFELTNAGRLITRIRAACHR
jgi:hypothetical protein